MIPMRGAGRDHQIADETKGDEARVFNDEAENARYNSTVRLLMRQGWDAADAKSLAAQGVIKDRRYID